MRKNTTRLFTIFVLVFLVALNIRAQTPAPIDPKIKLDLSIIGNQIEFRTGEIILEQFPAETKFVLSVTRADSAANQTFENDLRKFLAAHGFFVIEENPSR